MSLSGEYPQASDPHHLRQAREGILNLWQELPPEQQATLFLTLMQDVMRGAYRAWARESFTRAYGREDTS